MCRFIFLLVSFHLPSYASEYPKHWWLAVDKSSAPKWEILPHEAKPGEVILSKRNELGILSNFATTPFILDGVKYQSVEGYWQMMKFPEGPNDPRNRTDIHWPFSRDYVAGLTGFDGKRAGDIASQNMKELGINWVSYQGRAMVYRENIRGPHYWSIERGLRAKMRASREVQKILLSTGNLILRPDHSQGKNPPPAWQYHRIWMKLRAELKKARHRR